MFPKSVHAVAGVLAMASLALSGEALAAADGLVNLDVHYQEARSFAVDPTLQSVRLERRRLAQGARAPGFPSEFDDVLGVPTFLWAVESSAPAAAPLTRKALIEAWGRQHLAGRAFELGLTPQMIAQAELTDAHDTGRGALIARFAQRHAGLPVFTRGLNVTMKPSGALLAISGYFAVDLNPAPPESFQFPVPATQAISLGFAQLGGLLDASDFSELHTRGEYTTYSARVPGQGVAMTSAPRVRKVLYAHPLWLEPAFYIELQAQAADGSALAHSFVISALNGATLFRKNLVERAAYSYRVFADPAGINQPMDSPLGNGYAPFPGTGPDDVLARTSAVAELVTLEHGPISTADPWLPDGVTVTTGNNVDAYMDSGVTNTVATRANTYVEGSGDTRATTTGANSFDYVIVADQSPADTSARQAANVNLFYLGNWLHDWWYDHGFDEAAGNAQSSNYGRGGAEADPLIAQGQDARFRNNAQVIMTADGSSPIMELYLWDAEANGEVTVQGQAGIPTFPYALAYYGPASYAVTANVAWANDGAGASATDGCGAALPGQDAELTPAAAPQSGLQGKIALIDRGNCLMSAKTRFAQSSGALAAVIVNDVDGDPERIANGDATVGSEEPTGDAYTIPSVMIRKSDGQIVRDLLAGGAVSLLVRREPLDGALDNQLIAHEYFHIVSNRLVGDNAGLDNQQGNSLDEGWADMSALLLSLRSADQSLAGNESWQAPYSLAGYVKGDYYFGFRRAPYSTDFSRNALTFKHIADGEPLPAATPMRDSAATNAEIHNAGEIWATMLLECYAGILNRGDLGFDDARGRMKDYLIAGLKTVPDSPTYTEARDALVAAALASDYRDYAACARGFARRGAGLDAASPTRDSDTHEGVLESYIAFRSKFTLVAVEYVPDPSHDCDADAVLDGGESGDLRLTLRNDGAFVPEVPITATISTTLPDITFAGSGRISVPPAAPGESFIVAAQVSTGTIVNSRTEMPLLLEFDPSGDPAVVDAPAQTAELLLHYDGVLADEDGVCVVRPTTPSPGLATGAMPQATLLVLGLLGLLRRRVLGRFHDVLDRSNLNRRLLGRHSFT